jgi:hypothetical protein
VRRRAILDGCRAPQHTTHRHCSISALERTHTIRRSLVATVSAQRGRGRRRFEPPTSQARWKHYVAGLEGAERDASPFCCFGPWNGVFLNSIFFNFVMCLLSSSVVHEALTLDVSSRGLCLGRAQSMGIRKASMLEENSLSRFEVLEV